MAARAWVRVGSFLLLVILLAGGLWQCSKESTRGQTAGLQLLLRRADDPGSIWWDADTIEIEITRGGTVAARDTVEIDSSGGFATQLVVPSGGPYTVHVYGWGDGPSYIPDSTCHGVVAAGSHGGIEIAPYQVVTAPVDVYAAVTESLRVTGQAGEWAITAWWAPVPEATGYTLGWHVPGEALAETSAHVADTTLTIEWGSFSTLLALAGEPDSVLFRVRPGFGHRAGVFGESLWVDLSLWMDPPRLNSIAPASGDTIGADTADVFLCFDRSMDATSLPGGVLWCRLPDETPVSFDVLPEDDPAAFILEPTAGALSMGVDYRVTITSAVCDTLGRPFDGDSSVAGLQAHVTEWSTARYAPLQVVSAEPAPGDTGLARDVIVRLALNRPADAGTVTGSSVYVTTPDDSIACGSPTLVASGDTLLWAPGELLWFGTIHTLHATPEVKDLGGYPLDQDATTYPELEPFETSFAILSQPVGPRVAAVEPDSGAEAVPRTAQVRLTFNEPVDPSTVRHYDSFRVLREGSVGIAGEITTDAEERVFTFVPRDELAEGTLYEIRARGELTGGGLGITDPEGNPLDQDRSVPGFQGFSAWFVTEFPPHVEDVTFEPADEDTLVDIAPLVRLIFSRALNPATITPATAQLRLEGQELPSLLDVETDSIVCLQPTDSLDYNTRYSVWVDTLVAAPDGSLLDQDLAASNRQPCERFFTTEPESLHPRVVLVLPAGGDTQVVVTDSVWVTFSLPVVPSTVEQAFRLTRVSGEGAPAPVGGIVGASALSAVFVPDGELLHLTEYEVVVDTFVVSETGFALDQEPDSAGLQVFVSGFRTQPEEVPPMVSAWQPLSGQSDVSVDTDIELVFSEAMDPASVAAGFALLLDEVQIAGSGTLDGTGTIWTFDPEDRLEWGASHDVVVDSSARDVTGNRLDQFPQTPQLDPFLLSFTTEIDQIPPRVAWIEPDSAGTEVGVDVTVRVGFTESLLSESVTSSAFRVLASGDVPVAGAISLELGDSVIAWVPVELPDSLPTLLAYSETFTVIADTLLLDLWENGLDQNAGLPEKQPYVAFFTTMAETLAPRVLALLPGTQDVPIGACPAIVFSEPMDSLSLKEEGVVTLSERDGPAVAFEPTICASADTLTLLPEMLLQYDTEYVVCVDTAAVDLVGNLLDQEPDEPDRQAYSEIFRTILDTEPPMVVAVDPENGEAHVDPATMVRITFSEPVDPSTVHGGSVFLQGPGGNVPLASSPWLEESGTVAVLEPADTLEMGGIFTVFATHLICDLAQPPHQLDQEPDEPGNQDFTSGFSTGHGPVLVWDGPVCDWGDTSIVVFDARASFEDDPGDSICLAVWEWGDGSVDSLTGPDCLLGSHDYGHQDTRGCNGVDDDDDGWVDEQEDEGPSPCDESYRVTLQIYDTHGLMDEGTAGVSFCAFMVRSSDPGQGEYISPYDSVRVELTRPVDATSLDSSVVLLRLPDSVSVAFDIFVEDSARVVVLGPQDALQGGPHVLRFTPGVVDESGFHLDQDLYEPGRQSFEISFNVPIKPDDVPPVDLDPDPWPPPEPDQ